MGHLKYVGLFCFFHRCLNFLWSKRYVIITYYGGRTYHSGYNYRSPASTVISPSFCVFHCSLVCKSSGYGCVCFVCWFFSIFLLDIFFIYIFFQPIPVNITPSILSAQTFGLSLSTIVYFLKFITSNLIIYLLTVQRKKPKL